MPPRIVRFGYDVVSPYSFLAYIVIKRYCHHWNIVLDFEPLYLAGVMQLSGNTPPLRSAPARAKYILKDLAERTPKVYGIKPFILPNNFPANTLLAMRLLTVVKRDCPEKLEEITSKLWSAYLYESKDISDPKTLLDVVKPLLPNAEHILNHTAVSPEIKALLNQRTKDAVEKHGAFGAPTFWVKNIDDDQKEEMVFGSDRLDHLAMLMGKEWKGPLGPFSGFGKL